MPDEQLSGRSLDAAIAEKVFGLDVRTADYDTMFICRFGHCDDRDWVYEGDRYIYQEQKDHQPEWRLPHYSESIEAVMEVVTKLTGDAESGWTVEMRSDDDRTDKKWFVEFVTG